MEDGGIIPPQRRTGDHHVFIEEAECIQVHYFYINNNDKRKYLSMINKKGMLSEGSRRASRIQQTHSHDQCCDGQISLARTEE